MVRLLSKPYREVEVRKGLQTKNQSVWQHFVNDRRVPSVDEEWHAKDGRNDIFGGE